MNDQQFEAAMINFLTSVAEANGIKAETMGHEATAKIEALLKAAEELYVESNK